MKRLPADRLTAVGLVILPVARTHEFHDVYRAEKGTFSGFPIRPWGKPREGQERQGGPLVLLRLGQSEGFEDFRSLFSYRHPHLNSTEERSIKQVRGHLFVDAQLSKDDKLYRVAIERCKFADSAAGAGDGWKVREFHAANLRRVDLGIPADDPEVTVKQRRVE